MCSNALLHCDVVYSSHSFKLQLGLLLPLGLVERVVEVLVLLLLPLKGLTWRRRGYDDYTAVAAYTTQLLLEYGDYSC